MDLLSEEWKMISRIERQLISLRKRVHLGTIYPAFYISLETKLIHIEMEGEGFICTRWLNLHNLSTWETVVICHLQAITSSARIA